MNLPVQQIDFLPTQCRQERQERRLQPWLVATALVTVALVAAAAVAQHHRRRCADTAAATIAPAYQRAVDLQDQLAEVQRRLARAKPNAELYSYLRHPWPRSQLLAALVASLPDGIALERVQIQHQPPGATPAQARALPERAEQERLDSLPAAGRDLRKLRGQADPAPAIVQLSGRATDSVVLHRYLADLNALEVFERAELHYFKSAEAGRGGKAIQFRAVLAVGANCGQTARVAKNLGDATDANVRPTAMSRQP